MIILLLQLLGVNAGSLRLRVVIVEITRVGRVLKLGDDGTFDAAMIYRVPINGLEERMSLYIVASSSLVADSMRRIDLAERTNEVASI